MSPIKFSKYHGAGNDFVIIDSRQIVPPLSEEMIALLCDRHYGIGADGLMTLEIDPKGSDFYMRYWNSDGRESTMCGNGGRCISLFAHHNNIGGLIKKFNSTDGYHEAEIVKNDDKAGHIKLHMIDVNEVTRISDNAYFVNTGSPHYVEFVDNISKLNVYEKGCEIRNSKAYAAIGGTNVNFVQVIDNGRIRVRTYERGVEDETLACGTGVTAAAIVTSYAKQPSNLSFRVEAMGGKLSVEFAKNAEKFEKIVLSGPAVKVFDGLYQ